MDKSLRVLSANPSFYDLFKVKPKNTIGQLIYEMGDKQWNEPELREQLISILQEKNNLNNYDLKRDFAIIGQRVMRLNAQRIETIQSEENFILLAIEDITENVDELVIANKEKVKLEDKLDIAHKEKVKRADELVIANKEKIKRADELVIANKEKIKRADELCIVNEEKHKRADELIIANEEKELLLLKLKRAASVFSHTHEGIFIVDAEGIIIEINDSFSRISGYSADEILGKTPRVLRSGRHTPKFYAEMWSTLKAKGTWSGEIWNRNKQGEIHPINMAISAVNDTAGLVQHYVALSTDISPMKAHQRQLEHMAHYDTLTDMPNRVLLADRLNKAMVKCQHGNRSLAVAFMDLDGFKTVNDRHGHDMGDRLLVAVSKRMKEALREGDTLARIGGDEFIAVMVDLQSIEDSVPVLKRLLKAAAEPVNISDIIMQVSVSIGVTLYPQNGVDADLLMRHADQAMYVAKHEGKNRYHLFDTALANADKVKLDSIANICTALDRREFILHYQPKVNMLTGEVVGVEALIRWRHPSRGLVPPLEFLPAIEGHAVSLELGEWVIDTALTQISQWQKMGVNLPISVNISAYQLQQVSFTNRIASILEEHPEVNPRYLEFEILETSVLNDVTQVSATMTACHELGVHFALDDFGTGYSSLTHLRRLPAYLIKIDQSFVRDMLEDAEDLAIVKGVLGLAKAFRRDVIAEGVETIEHGAALLKLGCVLAQGYGIARPMPSDDIPKWLSSWKMNDAWQALSLIEIK